MVKIHKLLIVLMVFLFTFSVHELSSAAEHSATLQASEVSISQGESGYVDISLLGSTDIGTLSFAIFYDAEYLDVGYVVDDSLVEGVTVDYELDGEIMVTYEAVEALASEGTFLRIFFNVEAFAPTGLYPIDIEVSDAQNSLDEDITVEELAGHITVELNEIVIEEITFYSRVRETEGDFPILVYEVYSDDYKGLTSFNATVTYDPDYFFPFDASFGESLGDSSAYGSIMSDVDKTDFVYAGQEEIKDGEVLVQVRLEVIDLEAFTSSISFEATSLINQDLHEIDSNITSKEVSMDEGMIVNDYPDIYVTSYGGTENQSFDLYVKIEEGSMLYSGDFTVTYDDTILEVVRVQVGQNVNNKGGVLFFEDDVYDGVIDFTYHNETGLSEADTLLIMTFKAAPNATFDASDVVISGSNTVNHNFADIDLDYEDGSVEFFTAFSVRFIDYDGTLLSSEMYEENEVITEPSVPLRTNTVFQSWSESFDLATKNQTIKAIYELVEENILFNDKIVTYNGAFHSLSVSGLPVGATVEYQDNEYKNVGTYTVKADVYLDGVYQFTKEATLEITPKPITVTVGSHERVYGSVGSIAYTVNGKVAGDDLDIEVFTNDGYDVGIHALTAVVHNDNYVASIVDGTLEITKATYDMSNVSFNPMTYTKGGNTYDVYVSGTLPEGVSVTYINNGKTEVGSYTVTAEFYGDYQNYHEIDPMTTTLTIASPTILGPTFVDKTVVYNGNFHSISVSNLPSGADVVYHMTRTHKDAGTYTVEATISKAGYEDMTLVATLTIGKASYDMSNVTFDDESFEFDGHPHALMIGGSLPSGVTVTYEHNGQIDVGVYQVLAHFTSNDPNYQAIPSMSATLTILDNPYVDIVFEDKTVTYNGELHTLELGNIPAGATVVYSPGNSYVDAGEYIITATISLDGYDDYQMTATLTIEKERLVIRADNKSSIYNEDLLALTYTVEGTIYHEEVDIDIDKAYGYDAGTYQITVYASHENYDITLHNGTYTIEKATYDMSMISFLHDRVVFDGSAHYLEIDGSLPSGVSVDYVNNGQTDVGIYTVTASFTSNDDNYYQIDPMQARLIIEPAVMENLVFDSLEVVYDGDLHEIEVTNLPAGATVEYSPSNAQRASGVYEIKAVVSKEGYEDVTLYATLTIVGTDIDTSQLAFEDETYMFNDELKTLLLNGTLPEGVIGVEYEHHRRTEAGRQVVLLKVFVEDSYNPVPTMAALLDVTPAPMEGITFTGGDYVYDGTPRSFSISGLTTQYGHQVEVEYDKVLTYTNAGTYTVRAILTHPNYQTLILVETMVIEKASRTISESEFDLLVLDHSIQIRRDNLADLIYYSVNEGPFMYGTTIPSLEENTEYYIRIYLEETMNYKRSNIAVFYVKTYLSTSTVESMIASIGEVTLDARWDIIDVIEHIKLLLPSEQEAQTLALSQVIEEYNLLVETYEFEYKLAGDIVERLFPLELMMVNYQLATIEEIKRRDLI